MCCFSSEATNKRSLQNSKKITKKGKKYHLTSFSKIPHLGRSGPDRVRKIFAMIFETTFNWYPSNSNIWTKDDAKKILFTISGRMRSKVITNTIWDSNEAKFDVSKTAWTMSTIIQSFIAGQNFFLKSPGKKKSWNQIVNQFHEIFL